MIKALAAGDLLIDFNTISTDSLGYPALQANPGGDVGNYIAVFSKFGANASFIGKLGNDAFGNLIEKTLKDIGVNTSGIIKTDDAFTTLAFVTLDETGDREFSFARKPGADILLSFDEIDLSLLNDTDVLHISSVGMTNEPSRSALKKLALYSKSNGILISYDPNLRIPLWQSLDDAKEQMLWGLSIADVVKIGEEEIDFIYGLDGTLEQKAKKILELNKNIQLLFITCGAKGSYFSNRIHSGFVSSLSNINVIDTVGAGDIFGASAMFRTLSAGKAIESLSKADLEDITEFACAAAGLSTTRHGGIPSIPELCDVLKAKEINYGNV